ncbi:hypothetical protein SCP_1800100 [Sparassis crispa]|uniref:F-box domain-containing protein n=1 Tax=Sparassis crispa TaxID=139825 RepID=A0A401H6B3_9APHY|nr:hypothetical protein SCP_1800100 [Sparassis crispa]GBE89988.1 hypothetical protein SCP_1800100 [Sparassis crispa]
MDWQLSDTSLAEPFSELDASIESLRPWLADPFPTQSLVDLPCYINRFAPELLALTFQHVLGPVETQAREMFFWPSAVITSQRELRNLTQVCRYWYQVCHDTPLLWNTIYDTRNVECSMASLLAGYPQVPLNVYIGRFVPSERMMDLLRSDSWRIQNLNICFPTTDSAADQNAARRMIRRLPEEIMHALTQPGFPKLKWLELQHIAHCTNFEAPALKHLTIFSPLIRVKSKYPLLFRGHAPQLRTLTLRVATWLPLNRFPSLTHLHISCTPRRLSPAEENRATKWEVPELFSFMSRCPNLEDVVLWGIPEFHTIHEEVPVLHMRRLKRLVLGGMTELLIEWIFHHITMPATSAACRLAGVLCAPEELEAVIVYTPPLALRTIHIQRKYMTTAITFCLADESSGIRIETRLPRISTQRSEEWGWSSAIWGLCRLREVRELYLEGLTPLLLKHFTSMPALMTMLPALTTLVCSDGVRPELLLQYLAARDGANDGPCSPNLRTMHLCIPDDTDMECLNPLVAFAETRLRMGHPLRRVVIEVSRPTMEVESWIPQEGRIDEALSPYVESVELRMYEGRNPRPRWPNVCAEMPHAEWPPWP